MSREKDATSSPTRMKSGSESPKKQLEKADLAEGFDLTLRMAPSEKTA